MMYKARIFLSYSNNDKRIATWIASELRNAHYQVFLNAYSSKYKHSNIKNDSFSQKSDIIISIISRESADSKWIREEIDFAERLWNPIIPIYFASEQVEHPPLGLEGLHYFVVDESLPNGDLNNLINILNKYEINSKSLRKRYGSDIIYSDPNITIDYSKKYTTIKSTVFEYQPLNLTPRKRKLSLSPKQRYFAATYTVAILASSIYIPVVVIALQEGILPSYMTPFASLLLGFIIMGIAFAGKAYYRRQEAKLRPFIIQDEADFINNVADRLQKQYFPDE